MSEAYLLAEYSKSCDTSGCVCGAAMRSFGSSLLLLVSYGTRDGSQPANQSFPKRDIVYILIAKWDSISTLCRVRASRRTEQQQQRPSGVPRNPRTPGTQAVATASLESA